METQYKKVKTYERLPMESDVTFAFQYNGDMVFLWYNSDKDSGEHKEYVRKIQYWLELIPEPEEEEITIPRWQMKHIEDTLRLANNIHHSQNKVTCFDRQICKAWNWVKESLKNK